MASCRVAAGGDHPADARDVGHLAGTGDVGHPARVATGGPRGRSVTRAGQRRPRRRPSWAMPGPRGAIKTPLQDSILIARRTNLSPRGGSASTRPTVARTSPSPVAAGRSSTIRTRRRGAVGPPGDRVRADSHRVGACGDSRRVRIGRRERCHRRHRAAEVPGYEQDFLSSATEVHPIHDWVLLTRQQ